MLIGKFHIQLALLEKIGLKSCPTEIIYQGMSRLPQHMPYKWPHQIYNT